MFGDVDFQRLDCVYGTSSYKADVLRFFSSTEPDSQNQSNTFLQSVWDGYFKLNSNSQIEIEALGADVELTTGTENINSVPYTSRLRPLQDITYLKKKQLIRLNQIEIVAFDVTKQGSSYQSSDVVDEIIASQSEVINTYVSTGVLNAIPIDWMPNFCRPQLLIDDIDIFKERNNAPFSPNSNKADLSIGITLPYFENLNISLKQFNSLVVRAVCGQIIQVPGAPGKTMLKRYPLLISFHVTYMD